MNQSKFDSLYKRIMRGETHNISFTDACDFVEMLGFPMVRQKGTSHKIFKMEGIQEIINLQNKNGNAKDYQIEQIKRVIKKYKLGGKDDD